MQQKKKSVDDWIEGEHITWREHSGYVNFIGKEYITMCIREYCNPEEEGAMCKREMKQVNLLIYSQYWDEVIPCDSK